MNLKSLSCCDGAFSLPSTPVTEGCGSCETWISYETWNGWNIHKLKSTQRQRSWPETTFKQKKMLRAIFKLTIFLCREMTHSLLPFYHTRPWLQQKKGSQDAAVLTMIWTQQRCSTPAAWVALKHSPLSQKTHSRSEGGLRAQVKHPGLLHV